MQPVAATERAAIEAGFVALPARQDGSKIPVPRWRYYQKRFPTVRERARWWDSGERTGIGYVMGAISGNAECLDFDSPEAFERMQAAAGDDDVWARVVAGYHERTPRGHHVIYRCSSGVGRNRKLAPSIETRGEGGWVVVAPSHGSVHDSQRPYVMESGGPESTAVISGDERDYLLDLASELL